MCYFVVHEEVFEQHGGFIVKFVQLGEESALGQQFVEELKCPQCLRSGAVLQWLSQDGVAVMVTKDEHMLVASAGGGWKTSGLVCVDGARQGGWSANVCMDGRGPHRGRFRLHFNGKGGCLDGIGVNWLVLFGGLHVLAVLVQVSLGCGDGLCQMAGDVVLCESWPCGEMIVFHSFDECCEGRAETACMQVIDQG